MTKYDVLIDSICSELYTLWVDGCNGEKWDDQLAKSTAHHILEMVEEYQSQQCKLKQWRASD
jgi:hypothetical protein